MRSPLRLLAVIACLTPLGMVLTQGWPESVDGTLERIFLFALLQLCMLVIAIVAFCASLDDA